MCFLGGYKTERKDLGGTFCRKIDFWLVMPPSE